MYNKSQSDNVWFLRYYGPVFALLPTMDPENQNFEKMKKNKQKTKQLDTTILQMFTINDCHMIYGLSNMECNRQNFWNFGPFFALLNPPPNNLKNQNF